MTEQDEIPDAEQPDENTKPAALPGHVKASIDDYIAKWKQDALNFFRRENKK